MRVAYLNVNGFCGLENKRRVVPGEVSRANARKVCKALLEEHADAVFLSEFDVHSEAGQEAIRRMADAGYRSVLPNRWNYISQSYTSIVMAFAKAEAVRERSPENWLQWNELVLDGYRLIGLHITGESMWKDIREAYRRQSEGKLILIGDFNVSERESFGKRAMAELLEMGAKDAWIACRGEEAGVNAGYTYAYTGWDGREGYTRIDYALMAPAALERLISMGNRQEFYMSGLSDHAALVLEMA